MKRFNETRVGGQMILLCKWLSGQIPGELRSWVPGSCPGGNWWEYLTLSGFMVFRIEKMGLYSPCVLEWGFLVGLFFYY